MVQDGFRQHSDINFRGHKQNGCLCICMYLTEFNEEMVTETKVSACTFACVSKREVD